MSILRKMDRGISLTNKGIFGSVKAQYISTLLDAVLGE